jgi:outer membrane protein TolC
MSQNFSAPSSFSLASRVSPLEPSNPWCPPVTFAPPPPPFPLVKPSRFAVLALAASAALFHAAPLAATPVDYPESRLPELAAILAAVPAKAPELILKSIEQEESVARLEQARSGYYPRLDLRANFGYQRNEYEGNLPATDDIGLGYSAVLRRPLFHWGAIEARIRQARLDFANEGLARDLALRAVNRGIRADYLALLVNQSALRLAALRREQLAEQGKALRANLAAGLIGGTETEQNDLALSSALLDIEQLEADQARILARYRRTIGWDAPLALDTALAPVVAADILAWIDTARHTRADDWIATHAEVLRRRNLIEREKSEFTRITSQQRPLINVSASVGQGQSNTAARNNVGTFSYFAGVDVSWNIFDGFETRQRRVESALRRRRAETELSAFQATLAAEAATLLDTLSFQTRRLDLEQRRLVLARATFASQQREFETGLLATATFREKQLALRDAELAALRNHAALLMAFTDYLDLTTSAGKTGG